MSANPHPSSRLLDRAHHHDRSTPSIALFFFISCILFVEAIHAQYPQPAHGRLFDPDDVSRFDVLIPTDSLNTLLDPSNAYSNHEYRVTAIYTDAQGSDTLHDVGFRLRGNTSRNAQKKSFKISVNAFQDGRRFKGVKKINLNGQHNDPSMSRAFFSWKWEGSLNCRSPAPGTPSCSSMETTTGFTPTSSTSMTIGCAALRE